MKKVFALVASAIAVATLSLLPTTAQAATFGELVTINPTGGTNATDGLRIDLASTQIQVTRNGLSQFRGWVSKPDPAYLGSMLNYFEVSFTDGNGAHEIGEYSGWPYNWTSGTSSSELSADGKSGSVTNTLTTTVGGEPVTLAVTFSYSYPNLYVTVTTALTLPPGWTYPAHVYWNADTTLGGNDFGQQFEGVQSSGQTVRGVTNSDGTFIEAFRQVKGQNLNSWAGYLDCPWGALNCNLSTTSWVPNNLDAPDGISDMTGIDNGLGVSVPSVNSAGTHIASFDILFVGCDAGVAPMDCINAQVPPTPDPAPEEPTLPNTGVDSALFGGIATALIGSGVLFALFWRVRRAERKI